MPIVVSELYGMYYSLRSEARIAEQSEFIVSSREKRAQCVNRAWVLASSKLAALIFTCNDKNLLYYKRVILSFGFHRFIFLPVVFFSQNQARHLTK